MAKCLYLHDIYITKFDFMNYAYAQLVLAWLFEPRHENNPQHNNIAVCYENTQNGLGIWHRGIKLFSCSTQLSTKFILLINVKMPKIVDILTCISMINTTS